MSLLSFTRVSFRHSLAVPLIEDATFSIEPGDRFVIVGPNGAGKSTLLQLIEGKLAPDSGTVIRRDSLRIVTAQQRLDEPDALLFDFVYAARTSLARIRSRLAAVQDESVDAVAQLLDEYNAAGGYEAESQTERILTGLGFLRCESSLALSKLSGGQRTRAGLARALHSDAGLLLLDEPTNHLDVHAREWLEDQIAADPRPVVLVSHDRALLRRVANRVLEIERGRVRLFEGDYTSYRNQRALAERQAWEAYEGFERRKAAAEMAAQKRSRLAVKVATPPQGVRSSQDFYARKSAKVARTARLLRERVHREPAVSKPWEQEAIPVLDFAQVRRSVDIAISVRDISKSYGGRKLFSGVSFDVRRGERLAILGANGSGKTTLLRILLGLEQPESGSVAFGANVEVGHYAQDAENLDRSASPLEVCGTGTLSRTLLGCLKVRPERIAEPLQDASEGECAKVGLVRLLVSGANLLLLDEPTNHLDIETQETLEGTLKQYPGSILLVTHDRAFLEAIAADLLIELTPDA